MSDRKTATPLPYRLSITWDKLQPLGPAVDKSANFSLPDGGSQNAVGVLFSGLIVALGTEDKASRGSAIAEFIVPVRLPAKLPQDIDGTNMAMGFCGYKHMLRGFVEKHKDARVAIIVNAAGTTKVIEYPYDVELSNSDTANLSPDRGEAFFSVQELIPAGDPQAYPSAPAYGVEILVAVERRHTDATVHVQIDALDIMATFASPDAPPPSKT